MHIYPPKTPHQPPAVVMSSPFILPQPLRVLHESKHVLVIDKPAGLPFHRPAGDQLGLLQLCRQQQAAGLLPGGALFPVHRCAPASC